MGVVWTAAATVAAGSLLIHQVVPRMESEREDTREAEGLERGVVYEAVRRGPAQEGRYDAQSTAYHRALTDQGFSPR